MELGYHNTIKGIVLTSKSTELFKKYGKITLQVDKSANKLTIRNAVEHVWNVKVDTVRVVAVPGKTRRFAGKTFKSAAKKKAIVTLKKGYKIDLPGQFEAANAGASAAGSAESEEK